MSNIVVFKDVVVCPACFDFVFQEELGSHLSSGHCVDIDLGDYTPKTPKRVRRKIISVKPRKKKQTKRPKVLKNRMDIDY